MAKQNLLLVDDDAKSLRVLEVSLRNAGFAVTTAINGADGFSRAEQIRPALILSDTHMPAVDGYELCRRIKADPRFARVPFIFITDRTAVEDKIRALELGVDDYLTKPIYIKEVVTRVRIALQKRERESLEKKEKRRFFGSLEDMNVVDLLQTIEMGRKTGVILFERLPHTAQLWFSDGRVIDAEAGRLGGAEAVYRILSWEDGTFEMDFRSIDRPARINAGTQALLMEGMRRIDEWGRMLEQLPTIDGVYHVDFGELAERLADLPESVANLLRLFDGHRTALQAIYDADLPDLDALAAITRLYFEGIVYEVRDGDSLVTDPLGAAPSLEVAPLSTDAEGAAAVTRTAPDFDHADSMPAPGDLVNELLSAASSTSEITSQINLDSLANHATIPPGARVKPGAALPDFDIPEATAPIATPPPADPEPVTPSAAVSSAAIPTSAPASDAPPAPNPDVETVRNALRMELDDLFDEDEDEEEDEDEPYRSEPTLAQTDSAPAFGAAAVAQSVDTTTQTLAELDHEEEFFSHDPHAHQHHHDEPFEFDEPAPEPMSKLAWAGAGAIAVALLAGVAYFALRDSVEPFIPPANALVNGWQRDQIAARTALVAVPAIDAGWQIFETPDAAVADPALAPEIEITPEPEPDPTPQPEAPKRAQPAAAAPRVAKNPGGAAGALFAEAKGLQKADDFKDAMRVYKKALAIDPSNVDGLLGLANTAMELELNKDALRAAQKAVKISPSNARAHLLLGTSQQLMGRKEAAVEAYNRYLELAPNGAQAREVRSVLKNLQ